MDERTEYAKRFDLERYAQLLKRTENTQFKGIPAGELTAEDLRVAYVLSKDICKQKGCEHKCEVILTKAAA